MDNTENGIHPLGTTAARVKAQRKPQGFAALSPERRSEISRKGGKASQKTGRGHQWTGEEAQGNRRGKGFAVMSPEKRSEIAGKGGKAAHEQGVAHTWSSEEAQGAGRKGGAISRRGPKKAQDDHG